VNGQGGVPHPPKNLVAAFYKEIPTDLIPPGLEREGVRNLSYEFGAPKV
jgi:hypothetical protein